MTIDFSINGVGYSHVHATVVMTPLLGRSAFLQMTIRTCKSFEFDNNAKAVGIAGPQMAPVQLAPGNAEPTWSLEMALVSARDFLHFIGPGYMVIPVDVQVTYQLPGRRAITDYVEHGLIEKDGTKSASGDATLVTIGGKCRIVRPNGINPFRFP
jgi:hypothetical protein